MIAFKNQALCKFSNYSQFRGENQLSNAITRPLTSNSPSLPPKAGYPKEINGDDMAQCIGEGPHS